MEHKDLASILAGPSLTPEQAYNRATPAQRRAWFGDEPPTKAASQYNLPPAAPVGLPPHLEAKVAQYRAQQYGDQREPVCPACRSASPDGETVNGYCRHRFAPGQKALRQAEQRRASAMILAQQLAAGQLGTGSTRVVDVGRAISEDALRAELHQVVDQALLGF